MRCVNFIRCPIWLHSMLSNANLVQMSHWTPQKRDCIIRVNYIHSSTIYSLRAGWLVLVRSKNVSQTRASEPARRLADLLIQIGHISLLIGSISLDFVWFVSFLFHSDYIKVIDGNGITVLSRYGYSSVAQKTFTEVSFGNFGNITVQIYLRDSSSTFKSQFGILKQGPG